MHDKDRYHETFYDPELPWNHMERTNCPFCKSVGRRQKKSRGSGSQWVYPCGAKWNDYAVWPHRVGGAVSNHEGDIRVALNIDGGWNAQCAYIAQLIGALMYHVEGEDGSCRLDHHDYCQDHTSFEEGECMVRKHRRLLGLELNDA